MAVALYSLISEDRLHEVLQTLQAFTELPIQLLDPAGNLLCRFGSRPKYCRLLNDRVFDSSTCCKLLLKAGQYARQLGESYIFSCDANLNNIAFPLIDREHLLGTIIVGPFLMDKPDSTLLTTFAERYSLPPDLLLDLYDELTEFQVVAPERVNHLKRLLDHLLTPLLPEQRSSLSLRQKRLSQQSKINEAIQLYKQQGLSSSHHFLYEKERELLIKARTGNVAEAKALLNELLGYVFFSEGGSVEAVRLHGVELATLLSRVAMDTGAGTDQIHDLNNQFLSLMAHDKSMEDLCFLLQDVVETFMDAAFSRKETANHHIKAAVSYIAQHYHERLTLPLIARTVGLSEAHFSRLFKQCTGLSFREHLCRVRVEESKHLLRSTAFPLSDIAVTVGFPDQSYYCKVFRKMVGVTPGKFRC